MLKIEQIKVNDKVQIYPDLTEEDYSSWEPAQCLSTLAVNALLYSGCTYDLGGSGILIKVEPTGNKGSDAIRELISAGKLLFILIEENINHMPNEYKSIYANVLEQFQQDGLVMPIHGRIL